MKFMNNAQIHCCLEISGLLIFWNYIRIDVLRTRGIMTTSIVSLSQRNINIYIGITMVSSDTVD